MTHSLVPFTPVAAALAASALACVTDLRTGRIPNALTFGAAAGALLFHVLTGGMAGFGAAATGWAVGVLLFGPFFAVGGLGAGDVKLVAAIGAWLGPRAALQLAIATGIAGGVMAIALVLLHRRVAATLRNLWTMAAWWRAGVATVPGLTLADASGPRLAYALPIAAGTLVTVWLR